MIVENPLHHIAPKDLANHIPASKLPPHLATDRIVVDRGIEIRILKGPRHQAPRLRIVPIGLDLRGVDIRVVRAIQVEFERDLGRQIELTVERACTVAACHRGRGRELVYVRGAGAGPVEAFLNAVTFVLDLGEGQVDFGDDAGDVEALDVADAALVAGCEVAADGGEPVVRVFVADGDGGGDGGDDGEGGDGDGLGEMHCRVCLICAECGGWKERGLKGNR